MNLEETASSVEQLDNVLDHAFLPKLNQLNLRLVKIEAKEASRLNLWFAKIPHLRKLRMHWRTDKISSAPRNMSGLLLPPALVCINLSHQGGMIFPDKFFSQFSNLRVLVLYYTAGYETQTPAKRVALGLADEVEWMENNAKIYPC